MLEVERLCDRVIIMKKGRIEDDDSPEQILLRYNRTTLEDVFLDVARGRDRGAGVMSLVETARAASPCIASMR